MLNPDRLDTETGKKDAGLMARSSPNRSCINKNEMISRHSGKTANWHVSCHTGTGRTVPQPPGLADPEISGLQVSQGQKSPEVSSGQAGTEIPSSQTGTTVSQGPVPEGPCLPVSQALLPLPPVMLCRQAVSLSLSALCGRAVFFVGIFRLQAGEDSR